MTWVSWLFPGILLEIAVLMFMWYRRILRGRIFLVVPALLGFFTLLMLVMVVASYASEGPMEFTSNDYPLLIGGFVVLLGLILVIPHLKLGYKTNLAGERARERDLRDPPRKRSLTVDILGFFGVGLVLLLAFGVMIAIGAGIGR